jgi:hypothetical protein
MIITRSAQWQIVEARPRRGRSKIEIGRISGAWDLQRTLHAALLMGYVPVCVTSLPCARSN